MMEDATRRHLQRIVRSCSGARISRFLDRSIRLEQPGRAEVIVPFHPELTQNSDFTHGAVLFEVADTAGFVAASSTEESFGVLTTSYTVNFVRPVRGESVTAVAEVISRGRSIIVARSEVFSESKKLVAAGQGTYVVSRVPLAEIPGYSD